ncbi:MAG: acyl-CoA dehydrogenase family protein [Burkholderiales bacterium]
MTPAVPTPPPIVHAGPDIYGPPHAPRAKLRTHEVINQAKPFADVNLFDIYPALGEMLEASAAGWARPRVQAFGELFGSGRMLEMGAISNRDVPRLRLRDLYGNRLDEIDFSPAHHELMANLVAHEVGSLAWRHRLQPGAHAAQCALQLLGYAAEGGAMTGMCMTYAAPALLTMDPDLSRDWMPLILSTDYDPRYLPRSRKRYAITGLLTTEKQGGSDLRRNTTRAEAIVGGGSGREYALTGHKWYCSQAQADSFIMLANTEAGPTAFFMPRWLPDDSRNAFEILALKEKMGNRSNPTGEMEFDGTWAVRIGDEGRGIRTVMHYLRYSRLGFTIAPAGLMRQALVYAIHFARHRQAFGARLADKPLMRNVLADMALESEAATALAMRVARSYDEADAGDRQADAFSRIAVAISKYWNNKRAMAFLGEAMESMGAQGYNEDSPMPRLYRELHYNCIGEGPGNVICLDVLRAMTTDKDAYPALLAELRPVASADAGLARTVDALSKLRVEDIPEREARSFVETLATALQAALLIQHAPSFVADAFVASRLDRGRGFAFGTLPRGAADQQIIERAYPV